MVEHNGSKLFCFRFQRDQLFAPRVPDWVARDCEVFVGAEGGCEC